MLACDTPPILLLLKFLLRCSSPHLAPNPSPSPCIVQPPTHRWTHRGAVNPTRSDTPSLHSEQRENKARTLTRRSNDQFCKVFPGETLTLKSTHHRKKGPAHPIYKHIPFFEQRSTCALATPTQQRSRVCVYVKQQHDTRNKRHLSLLTHAHPCNQIASRRIRTR